MITMRTAWPTQQGIKRSIPKDLPLQFEPSGDISPLIALDEFSNVRIGDRPETTCRIPVDSLRDHGK